MAARTRARIAEARPLPPWCRVGVIRAARATQLAEPQLGTRMLRREYRQQQRGRASLSGDYSEGRWGFARTAMSIGAGEHTDVLGCAVTV